MNKVSIKGVVIGGVTDIVSTNVLALPLLIYVAAAFGMAHVPKEQMQSALLSVLQSHPLLYAAQMLIGVSCSVLGGYVAARIAKHDMVLNGALSSFLCVGGGIYSMASGKDPMPLVQHLLWLGATPLVAAVGGYFGALRAARRDAVSA